MLVRVVIWHLADVEALLGISLDKRRGHAGMIVTLTPRGRPCETSSLLRRCALGALVTDRLWLGGRYSGHATPEWLMDFSAMKNR
jgi:hypothetical protein